MNNCINIFEKTWSCWRIVCDVMWVWANPHHLTCLMHVDLVLLRRGPLITDSKLVEWRSSVPGESSFFDSEASLFFYWLRSRKPKYEAHDDRSQFELSTCSSSGKKKQKLNLATSKNASLTSRGHWSLDHVPSQRIIHRSIKFVAFVLVPVF